MHTSKAKPWASRFWRLALAGLLLAGVWFGRGVDPVQAQARLCPLPFEPVSQPLTELGSSPYVRMDGQATDFTGGLYPGGSNARPPAHEAAGLAAAARIQPLDAAGRPNAGSGKIVLLAVGMSNVNMEFGQFIKLASQDSQLNPRLVLVNAAQNGQVAPMWVAPDAPAWDTAGRRLEQAGVTPLQVQVAWVKQTRTGGGNFPILAEALQADLEAIVHNLKEHYPNLQIAYFSSRTRSYTYWRGLSPEPQAFETGFAVKWMIEKQINGDARLNFDPAKGAVQAPYLAWGPYLWLDGLNPRTDGMTWVAEDMVIDCTHPSDSGVAKVVAMLMRFLKSDSTAIGWFLKDPGQALAASPTAPAPTGAVPPGLTPASQPSLTPQTRATQSAPTPIAPAQATQPPAAPTLTVPTAAAMAPAGVPGGLQMAGFIVLAFFSGGLAGYWLRGRRW